LLRTAWDAHTSWLYVDALDLGPECVPPVLRLAEHLLDDDCLLVWDYQGDQPLRGPMVLPTPAVRAALAEGQWLET
jgi:hypothetical protein